MEGAPLAESVRETVPSDRTAASVSDSPAASRYPTSNGTSGSRASHLRFHLARLEETSVQLAWDRTSVDQQTSDVAPPFRMAVIHRAPPTGSESIVDAILAAATAASPSRRRVRG
jgi:hypothetical protein